MASSNEAQPACTPLAGINMSSPLVLRDWNEAFKLSTPIRSSPTPSKTNWKLGAPQVGADKPCALCYAFHLHTTKRSDGDHWPGSTEDPPSKNTCNNENSKSVNTPGATRYANAPAPTCSQVVPHYHTASHAHMNFVLSTGAALASTPAQSGQRYLPKSRTADLIAPSLAKLPNALDAEYWLNKIKVQEDLGNYQVESLLVLLYMP